MRQRTRRSGSSPIRQPPLPRLLTLASMELPYLAASAASATRSRSRMAKSQRHTLSLTAQAQTVGAPLSDALASPLQLTLACTPSIHGRQGADVGYGGAGGPKQTRGRSPTTADECVYTCTRRRVYTHAPRPAAWALAGHSAAAAVASLVDASMSRRPTLIGTIKYVRRFPCDAGVCPSRQYLYLPTQG